MKKMKWIIFDAMGVVFKVGDDVNELLIPFIGERNKGVTEAVIDDEYNAASNGEITSSDFWQSVGLGDDSKKHESDYLSTRFELKAGFVEFAQSIKGRYEIGMISNDIDEWSTFLRSHFGLDDLFDHAVISSRVKMRKPRGCIFKKFLDEVDADPGECVFIDDKLANVKAADDMGIHGIFMDSDGSFIRIAELIDDIENGMDK